MRAHAALVALVVSGTTAGCIDFGGLGASDEPVAPGPGDASVSDAGALPDAARGGDAAGVTDSGAGLDSGGAPDGATSVDAGLPWKVYTTLDSSSGPFSVLGLDQVWSGPNAPPPRDIMVVTQLDEWDRLLVFSSDGKFYLRADGVWKPPQPIATVFPALAGRDLRGMSHQPAAPGSPQPHLENLTFCDDPTAILYTYSGTDGVAFAGQVTMTDEPPPYGAPKGTGRMRWALQYWRPAQFGTAQYLADYYAFDNDPNVYLFDATPAPANKWLFANAPIFAHANPPPQTSIMAAWRDDKVGANYFVVK